MRRYEGEESHASAWDIHVYKSFTLIFNLILETINYSTMRTFVFPTAKYIYFYICLYIREKVMICVSCATYPCLFFIHIIYTNVEKLRT